MQLVYNGEEPANTFSKSIFLAGPTTRSKDVPSWRPDALRLLKECGYDEVVFIPEDRAGTPRPSYDDQINWEHKMLNMADCVLFWIPRDLKTLPGFTTNVEFGLFANSGKVILGSPPDAEKMNYLRLTAKKFFIPSFETLEDTIDCALKLIGEGAPRTGGEREIPIHIWRTQAFQKWLAAQKGAGNRLDGAALKWVCRVGPKQDKIYAWAIHVSVYVTSEKRHKTNEVIIGRPDISTVVLYKPTENILDTIFVLVKEFRSPATTRDGFIWEFSGGSTVKNISPVEIACEETKEEVGLSISARRMKVLGSRQLAGTFSTHKAHAFAAVITDEELAWCRTQKGIIHGIPDEGTTGERTYIEIKTLGEILNEPITDWATLGIAFSSIFKE